MSFRTPAGEARAELRERGSRFLAIVVHAADEEGAAAELERIRKAYPGATHHCWARRLGWPPAERGADAGEPSGTAGVPMLHVLRGAGLSDVLAVVVRWYGGTKLGKGGLARAYSGAVRAALEELSVRVCVPSDLLGVEAPYESIGSLKRLVRPPEVEMLDEEYGECARFVLRVHRDQREGFDDSLADLGLSAQTL